MSGKVYSSSFEEFTILTDKLMNDSKIGNIQVVYNKKVDYDIKGKDKSKILGISSGCTICIYPEGKISTDLLGYICERSDSLEESCKNMCLQLRMIFKKEIEEYLI